MLFVIQAVLALTVQVTLRKPFPVFNFVNFYSKIKGYANARIKKERPAKHISKGMLLCENVFLEI